MGRLWKFNWPASWFISRRLSTSSTNSIGEIDLALGTESGFFQSKPSSVYPERKNVFKEKAFFSSVSPFGRWIKLGSGFLFLLLFLCIVYSRAGWKRNFSTPELSHFSIVFDCGSTGTRVHVYEWLHDKGKSQGSLPMLVHSRSEEPGENSDQLNGNTYPMMQTEPGLDKYLHNESGLRASIEPLLRWAEQVVPPYAHSRTHVYLLATAGLRRLPVSGVNWILDKLWTIFLTSPFRCQRSWTRVISGVEEAYYGWVALNYEMNKLQNVPRQATFGAIDLGGSSLEVTFESGKENKGEYAVKLKIGIVEHQLNAYSIPGYGLNDAFEKSIILLYRRFLEKNSTSANHQLQLRHPCLHVGYRQSFYCSKWYPLHPDGSTQNGRRSKGNELFAPKIELVGDPNWVECQTLAKSTVHASLWSDSAIALNCDHYPCALDKHQPQPRGRFFLLSGFFFVYRFFNLTSTASYEEILEKGQHYCLKTWQDASRSAVRQPFIEQHCFHAPYIVALLRDGLHLRDTQVIIGSGGLTWTLGAALLEAANLFPSNEELEGRYQPVPDKLTIAKYCNSSGALKLPNHFMATRRNPISNPSVASC